MNVEIWLGLLSGTAFGFVIQRIGATDPDKMTRAHLMMEPDIPKFMLMVVVLSAFGLTGLLAVDTGLGVLVLLFGSAIFAVNRLWRRKIDV